MGPMKKIGAIWFKTSKSGNDYMSIDLSKVDPTQLKAVGFKNKFKKEDDNKPDYDIFQNDTELANAQPNLYATEQAKAIKENLQKKMAMPPYKALADISKEMKEPDFFNEDDVPF